MLADNEGKTPLCPIKILGAEVVRSGGLSSMTSRRCSGSECAFWAPYRTAGVDLIGVGRCGLAPTAQTYPDPARKTEGE